MASDPLPKTDNYVEDNDKSSVQETPIDRIDGDNNKGIVQDTPVGEKAEDNNKASVQETPIGEKAEGNVQETPIANAGESESACKQCSCRSKAN